MPNPIRRLIETDEMPIGQISAHARKGQNVRKGAPTSGHARGNDTGVDPSHAAATFGEAP